MPIGDDDKFDWKSEKISFESLVQIIEKKERIEEIIGVILTWQDTGIGGQFLFRCNGIISVNVTLLRKLISSNSNVEITDINWYLTRLLNVFNEKVMQVEHFSYQEHV